MPAVAKTSPEHIVAQSGRLISKHGVEAFSMQTLARAVGVKPPSLYKHFPHREAIIRAVTAQVTVELARRIARAVKGTGRADLELKRIAQAQRSYARAHPALYGLIFKPPSDAEGPSAAESGSMLSSMFSLLAGWMGSKTHVLEGARLLVAFTHGFISMENAGAFRLGGDVELAFDFGLRHLLDSLAAKKPSRRAEIKPPLA